MLIPPRCPGIWLQGRPDLFFNRSSSESSPRPTLLRFSYETCRISKVGYLCYVKIKGKENTLSSGERNIRTTARSAGREQVVHSLPNASLFLHVCLSCALKSASDGQSRYQSANIRVDSYYNVPFSHLLVPQKKQTAWVKECIPPYTCQKSLAHSVCSVPLILYITQAVFILDSYCLIFPLIAWLGNVRRDIFFLPFLLFVFLLSILFNWDCKMKAVVASLVQRFMLYLIVGTTYAIV